jgi:hypothetical protein
MPSAATRRTIRRCTALLLIVLAMFIILVQTYLGYRGLDTFTEVYDTALFVSYATLFGALAYLIGSIGLSVSGSTSTETAEPPGETP